MKTILDVFKKFDLKTFIVIIIITIAIMFLFSCKKESVGPTYAWNEEYAEDTLFTNLGDTVLIEYYLSPDSEGRKNKAVTIHPCNLGVWSQDGAYNYYLPGRIETQTSCGYICSSVGVITVTKKGKHIEGYGSLLTKAGEKECTFTNRK